MRSRSYTTGRHHFYAGYRHVEMDLKGGTGEKRDRDLFRTGNRLRFQLLRSDSKQLKNKAKSRVFLV